MKKLFSLILAAALLSGLLPAANFLADSADAKAKKKTRKIVRSIFISGKKNQLKKSRARLHKKAKPAVAKNVTVRFSVEEGADQTEADNIVEEVKTMGADDAEYDLENNILQAKFNTKKMTAKKIITALKPLGYTLRVIK